MNKIFFLAAAAIAVAACGQTQEADLKEKVESYAVVEVSSPLYDALSENDKKIVGLFRQAAEIMDDLFWKQTFGDKAELESLKDEYQKAYAMINYGAWDHLDDNNDEADHQGDPAAVHHTGQDVIAVEGIEEGGQGDDDPLIGRHSGDINFVADVHNGPFRKCRW